MKISASVIYVLYAVAGLAGLFVGYRARLFAATAMFVRLVISLLIAAAATPLVMNALHRLPLGIVAVSAFLVLSLLLFFILTIACLRWLDTDAVVFPLFIDRVGGSVFGAVSGLTICGVLLILWSVAVGFSPVKFAIDEQSLKLDMGTVILKELGRAHVRFGDAASFNASKVIEQYRTADELKKAKKE